MRLAVNVKLGRQPAGEVPLEGLEPPLLRLEGACFVHLSYRGLALEIIPDSTANHRRKKPHLVPVVEDSIQRGGLVVDEGAPDQLGGRPEGSGQLPGQVQHASPRRQLDFQGRRAVGARMVLAEQGVKPDENVHDQ